MLCIIGLYVVSQSCISVCYMFHSQTCMYTCMLHDSKTCHTCRPVCCVLTVTPTDLYVVSQTCMLCVTGLYGVSQTCMLCWLSHLQTCILCHRPVCCVSLAHMLCHIPVCFVLCVKCQCHSVSSVSVFRYPFHPRVTTVARKRTRSFCQKCRWQVTAKHAYTLRMWLCMKWHGAWLYGVHRTCTETAAVSCGTSHASAVSTPLWWIFKKRAIKASHSCRTSYKRNESAQESGE